MKRKEEKGITLIALVITIIVLLILVMITIAAITGPNGIMNKATKAKTENAKGEIQDRVRTEVMGSYDEDGKIDWELLEENIIKNVGTNSVDATDGVDKSNGITFEVEKNGRKYTVTVDPNGNVTVTESGTSDGGEEEPPFDGTATQSLVGSDVQYTDIDGNPDTADWKLFYVVPEGEEDAGAYYLITSDYLDCSKESNFPTSSPSAYSDTGMNESSGTYVRYWRTPTGNLITAYGALGNRDASGNKKFYFDQYKDSVASTVYETYEGAKAVAGLLNPNYWAHLKRNSPAIGEEIIGSPTLELWCKAWNAKEYKTMYCNNINTWGVNIGWTSNPTSNEIDYTDINVLPGYQDKLFYPHTEEWNSCHGFWLASPSSRSNDYIPRVDYNGGINNSHVGNFTYGLRPVVYIPSSVKLTKSGSTYNLI